MAWCPGPHAAMPSSSPQAPVSAPAYVLEGDVTFVLEDDEIVAAPGTFVLVPPGVEHTFANRTAEPARILNIHAPAGFDHRLLGR